MLSKILDIFRSEEVEQYDVPEGAKTGLLQVTGDATRCVQCGICGYNCPVAIPVREYARRGQNVTDPRCIACGACVEKCPRGTLRWGPAILVRADNTLEVNPHALPDSWQLQPRDPLETWSTI